MITIHTERRLTPYGKYSVVRDCLKNFEGQLVLINEDTRKEILYWYNKNINVNRKIVYE